MAFHFEKSLAEISMNRKIVFLIVSMIISVAALCQTKPVKVIFDVTSKDTLIHQVVLRHISSMAKSYPESLFEVVVYGGALPMFVKNQSTVSKGVQALENNKNVSFKVCAVTMKRYNVEATQLLPKVEVVADGIMEIVTKQGEGWAYIKEAHN
jgi:uncharacterized protein